MQALQLQIGTIFNNSKLSYEQLNASPSPFPSPSSLHLRFRDQRSLKTKSIIISCNKSSNGRNRKRFSNGGDDHNDYIQAVLLATETIKHYHLRNRGFREETIWNTALLHPFSLQTRDSTSDFSSFGHVFLRRFRSPTIFLKIACDRDLLLPIAVGEFAIQKLVDILRGEDEEDDPDQFCFLKSVVDRLGYEVKMVRITERIMNTYCARIYFSKPGDKTILSVDARPSDAINMATIFRFYQLNKRPDHLHLATEVPIFVNKQLVLTDAIVYGRRRGENAKTVYDVTLDSAAEGDDLISEELHLVGKLNIAIKEERYKDAASLKNKLTKLRTPKQEV